MEHLKYIKSYRNDKHLRDSFNSLTREVYGFDFEDWYRQGWWSDSYDPHSIIVDGKIVANASVNHIDFDILNQSKRYLQVGTVMTHPDFQGRGYSRYIMERIMDEYSDMSLIYLVANDSVLDFYPRFGFEKADEYVYSKVVCNHNYEAVKVSSSELVAEFPAVLEGGADVFKLAMRRNPGLVMFYCGSIYSENIYYIKRLNAFAVVEYEGEILFLHDVYAQGKVSLDDVINSLARRETTRVILGFTPSNTNGYDCEVLREPDTTLFVYGPDAELFKKHKLRFPLMSHA